MAGSFYGKKIFWPGAAWNSFLTHGKRYDFIFFTMDDELGDSDSEGFFPGY